MDELVQANEHLIISVVEVRKLLGKEHASLTDEQIEDLIVQLDGIASLSIKQSIERTRQGEDYNKTIKKLKRNNAHKAR